LVPLLESEDATLRSFGTKWLGELEASAGTDALWKIARGDRPLVDRLAALDALAKIAPDIIVEGLIRLESRQDLPLTFHRSLLTTLAAINSPEAALHLRDRHEVLKRDEEGAAELRLHLTWLLSPAFQKEWLEARALRRRRIDEGRLDLDETLPVPPR
ncbi:MAG: hypothetical protein KDB53_00525, partial [Planctomycetes bacterium]|nr:hypothetical protein [Planctomycetota bacterium]